MKSEELLYAVGGIDEQYIRDAERLSHRALGIYSAAVLLILIVSFSLIGIMINERDTAGSLPADIVIDSGATEGEKTWDTDQNTEIPDDVELNETMEERIMMIVSQEAADLMAELEQEKDNDPLVIGDPPGDPCTYKEFESIWKKWEAVQKELSYNPQSISLLDYEKALSADIERTDPDGIYRAYLNDRRKAEERYGRLAYYTHKGSSPYIEGIAEGRDSSVGDPALIFGGGEWPVGMVNFAKFDLAITGKVVGRISEKELMQGKTENEKERKNGEDESESEIGDYFIIEVCECFFGGLKKKDQIILSTEMLAESLVKDMSNRGEWMLFLYRKEPIEGGFGIGVYSTRTTVVFTLENGRIHSTSVYRDINQYDGSTPEELVLAMLRIRAKYIQDLPLLQN